ncbi:MAG: deoxyribonuclease IV [Deltaproteobacteria bacterium]|nr:deoxyribonuclease IV [Deltaproteobacteria bacterium]
MPYHNFFGAHIPISKGLESIIDIVKQTGIKTAQIHPSAPQRWIFKEFDSDFSSNLSSVIKASGLEKMFFHGIYLINLASPDENLVKKSIKSLQIYLNLLRASRASGVVFHPGSITDKAELREGLKRVINSLKFLVQEFGEIPDCILLEVSAGREHVVGSKLEHFASILDALGNPKSVAIALDTQHLWASGYDLLSSYDAFVAKLKNLNLLSKIKLIHINDIKSDCGSYIDRHENIGKGRIGSTVFKRVFSDNIFKEVPLILETPAVKNFETLIEEVRVCRELMET